MSWPAALKAVSNRTDLTYEQSRWLMDAIMDGQAGAAQFGALLLGLATKGETVDEVAGFSDSMQEHGRTLSVPSESLDIVGTGGDQLNTVNISTMSVITAAAAGVPIVKHGNRSASSMSGSADVLEALGVNLEAEVEDVEKAFRDTGIAFVFAQVFHPSMRHAAPVRKELAVPTIFNLLGPLTNPARPVASAIGAPKAEIAEIIAGVLARRGSRGLVFQGHEGLDELSVTTGSTVWEIRDGRVTVSEITPEEVGLQRWTIDELTGGDARHNAGVVHETFAGTPGAVRDAVLLNTAGGLVAFDPSDEGPLTERLARGVERARTAIDSGAAAAKLEQWISSSAR